MRADCGWCNRELLLRLDGTLPKHRPLSWEHKTCPGSGSRVITEKAVQQVRVRQVQESLAELKEMQHAYGDAGTVAFILGIPVQDVLRVTGDRGHDLEEIDPRDLTNTT